MENGVVVTEKKDFDPFKMMDMLDDDLILQELEGRIVDTWAYHIQQEGKDIWGLSKVGVDMASREMAKNGEAIREEDVSYTPDPTDSNYVLFKACASRVILSKEGQEIYLDKTFGTKRQAICYFKDGIPSKSNPFWFEQGTMKALRNAKARLISDDVRSKIMTMAKEKGKTKGVINQPLITAPQAKKVEDTQQPLIGDTIRCVVDKVEKSPKSEAIFITAEDNKFSTFDKKIAEAAKALIGQLSELTYTTSADGKYKNLTSIAMVNPETTKEPY